MQMAKINDLPILPNPTEDMYCLVGKDDLKKVPWSAIMGQIGSPYVATSISQMTDKTRVYVYYGEESGYIKGNWYYWNANTSAWTSGKKYNSEGIVTDETLAVPGKAADAKATGDKIKKTKEDLENALKDIDVTTDTTLTKTGKAADAKATGDAIKKVKEDVANIDVATDTTLAVSGKAADAKATGDKIKKISDDLKNTMPYYPIATEEQARAGVDDTVMMTPLKVAMACEEFGGSGGGGGNVNVATLKSSFIGGNYAYGSPIDIRYRFASPVSGDGTLHVMVDSVETVTETVPQGTNRVTLNDLNKGNHTITMYVVDASETFTDTLSFSVRVGTLDITSTFDDSTDFNIVNVIKVPITIDTISIDPIYLVQTIDGVETRLSAQNGYNVITLPTMSAGAHKVLFHAESGSYKSQTLTYNIIIEDADNLTLITDFDTKTIQYKDMLEIPYRVSMKGQTKFTAQYFVDDTVVKEVEIPSGTNVWATSTLDIGAHTLKILVTTKDGSKSAYIEENVIVQARDYTPMEPVKDASLLCWFDATGRTNQDIGKETWTDKSGKGVVATLHNFNYNTNGWENNALKCNGQAYVEIDLEALADNAPYGMTVDIRYNTRDVGNQDACVLDMRGNDTYSKGFAIDTEYMYMNSASSQLKSTVEQDSISKATFVIDRDNKIAKIYNNGVLTETFLMQDSENFTNNTKIFLGTKLETVDSKWVPNVFGNCEIYSFRVYARALDSEEIVKNFVADIPDMDEQQAKYLLNYENAMPTMYFYGDTSAMTKENKVPLRIKYISGNADEYGASFDLENCQVGWQGTSSLQYAVKNYKIKLKNPDGSKYKYSPFKNGILEDTFCLKADYMESSHANNTGMAKFINDELYDTKVPPQQTNSKVRTAINGFPIQLYIAKDSASTPVYMGVFNFNLDKGCNKSFGLDNEVTGQENCISFEVSSNSDTSAGAFKNDTDESLRTDFELRYPDEDDCTSEQITEKYNVLKRLVTWVKNADETTFKNELEQYFNKEYLLKYFLQVHLFGMVDNLGKNMMLTTWDGNIWYPQFYDLDTQLGLDNTGYLKFYSDIDITEGVYNTSGSKLWTMVQNVFADELSTMYKKLRTSKYRLDNILKYWYDGQVAQIGELQYNKDMEAKYIKFKNDYLFMLHGRRSEHMKKWVKERLLYLDTIYGYEEDTKESITIRANTTANINLDILTYSPQYLTVRWRNGVEQRLKVGRDANGMMKATRFNGTLATATDQEIIVYNAKQIKKIDGLTNANPSTLNLVEASRLVEVDCQNAKVLNDIRLNENNKFISKIKLNGCTKLGDTSTGKSSVLDLSMFAMLSEVNLNDTLLTNVLFPTTGCNLKTLQITSSKLQSLSLKNMPLLGLLSVNKDAILSEFTVENCPEAYMRYEVQNGRKTVLIRSETILISGSPKLFVDDDVVSINITNTVNGIRNYNTPLLRNLKLCDIDNIPILLISGTGAQDSYKETHIETFKIDCGIGFLRLYGMGFKTMQEQMDINMERVKCLMLKRFTNIRSVHLTSKMNGVYIGNEVICGETYKNGYFYNNTFGVGTSRENGNYTNMTKLESIYMDDVEVTDTIDFSNNPKMGMLALDETVIPESIGKVIANCDFTAYKTPEWMYNGYNARFYLPPTFEVEGYIKTTSADKLWPKTSTNTAYPPLRNFEKLTLELDEDFNDLSQFFKNFKALEKLPDCITPEVIGKCKYIHMMLDGCTALTNINRLEGADIEIRSDSEYDTVRRAFAGVKGPFTLGNVSITNTVSSIGYDMGELFVDSGLTSVGDVTLNNVANNRRCHGIFRNCQKLTSVGNISINLKGLISVQDIFSNTPLLKHIESFNINLVDTSISFYNAFANCGITDYSSVNIPINASLPQCFAGGQLKLIENIPNYKEVIRTATNLSNTFNSTQIENVPDLVIDNATVIDHMFFGCKKLREVASITGNANITNITEIFRECDKLERISKVSFPNMQKSTDLYSHCNILYMSGKSNSTGQIVIDYLNLGKTLAISKNEITNNAYDGMFGFFQCPTPVKINFQCNIGTIIEKTGWLGNINGLPDVETLNSFADHALALDSPYTLKVSKNIYSLFTSEILAKLSAKNWTIASA
jgi:hypothetical protein